MNAVTDFIGEITLFIKLSDEQTELYKETLKDVYVGGFDSLTANNVLGRIHIFYI